MAEEINPFHQQIRNLFHRRPFVPFTVVLKGGQRYEITSWQQFALNEYEMIVVPPNSAHKFFRLNQIASVLVHEPVA